jgi:hypothetical protein
VSGGSDCDSDHEADHNRNLGKTEIWIKHTQVLFLGASTDGHGNQTIRQISWLMVL